jgi:hypothetical protein
MKGNVQIKEPGLELVKNFTNRLVGVGRGV